MCSVPFGLVALGRVAALNPGSGSHGRLGRIASLGRIPRLGRVDLSRGRRGRVCAHHGALGSVAALHDLGLDVAGLNHGLDHGRRVDDGRRVR